MVSLEEVKEYLAIDFDDVATNHNLTRLIQVADKYLIGAVGSNYPTNDPRVKEISLIIISDLFDNHSMNDRITGNTRRLVNDMILQLQLELRRQNNGA